jgi:hypothetical protein
MCVDELDDPLGSDRPALGVVHQDQRERRVWQNGAVVVDPLTAISIARARRMPPTFEEPPTFVSGIRPPIAMRAGSATRADDEPARIASARVSLLAPRARMIVE